jgi:hypothetical protein
MLMNNSLLPPIRPTVRLELYRDKIQRLYRRWQLCWLPGYEYRGQLQEAYCRWLPTRSRRYWTFVLNYGQLDHWAPFDGIFETALEQVGPDDVVNNLWKTHENEFSRRAILHHGGWRWWSGTGLSEPFVYALRDLLIDHYSKARVLYESWPIDVDNPYDSLCQRDRIDATHTDLCMNTYD